MRTNPRFLTDLKSTIKFGCPLKIYQLKMGVECENYNQNFLGHSKSRKKINEDTFRLNLSEPMKIRGVHDVFHCSLLRPFIPDKYGRHDEGLPPVKFIDGSEEYEVESILDSNKMRANSTFY